MKKQSFFERLAGNLRFNDNEEEQEIDEEAVERTARRPLQPSAPRNHAPIEREAPVPRRELPLNTPLQHAPAQPTPPISHIEEEEIGELPVDVYETQNEIVIQTLIAGVLPEHLSISITRDVVTIAGKREENKAISHESYQLRELYWGKFERTIDLPEEIEIDTAEAIERHGMLMIKLPKLDKRRKATLKIKSI